MDIKRLFSVAVASSVAATATTYAISQNAENAALVGIFTMKSFCVVQIFKGILRLQKLEQEGQDIEREYAENLKTLEEKWQKQITILRNEEVRLQAVSDEYEKAYQDFMEVHNKQERVDISALKMPLEWHKAFLALANADDRMKKTFRCHDTQMEELSLNS